MNADEMLDDYKTGCSFWPNDILRPKSGKAPVGAHGVKANTVVVLDRSSLCPHKYTVVGEAESYRAAADKFIKFEVNGHEWECVGNAAPLLFPINFLTAMFWKLCV